LCGTVSPLFELGYRFPEGFGEFLVSYRFLVDESTNPAVTDIGSGHLKTRLDLNENDFDYVSREYSLAPKYDLRWRLGARLAGVYFDSRLAVVVPPDNFGGGRLWERTSNNFFGAGPHVGLELARKLDLPGSSIFLRVDGASVFGRIHQRFGETFTLAEIDDQLFGGVTAVSRTQTVPILGVQAGVAWSPVDWRWATFSLGYVFEQWWNVGRVQDSTAEVMFQGLFVQAEFRF
jgi:hypothetical protein